MTILLDNDLEQLINAKLEQGACSSASELLRESLRLLEEREASNQQSERWRQEIASGARQLREGRSVELDNETLAGIKARGRAKLAQQPSQQEKA